MNNAENLVEIKNLCKYFHTKKSIFNKNKGVLKAVDGVSLAIKKGETLGLVGESGCGKTTLGRTLLKLYNPTSGEIIYNNDKLENLSSKKMLPYRKKMQMIFQDPYASLNPRLTVGDIIGEPLDIYKLCRGKEREEKIKYFLDKVGLDPNHIHRYPHEFSGGQRQRIAIARCLTLKPEILICDESVSALDVSVQAQVLNLLQDLQDEFGLSYIFISHDLSVVKYISDQIMVLNHGDLVEIANSDDLYQSPQHDYTKRLLSAIPQGIPQ